MESNIPSIDEHAARAADRLRRQGRPEEARKQLEEALREQDSPSLRVLLGLVELDLGDVDASRIALERALDLLDGKHSSLGDGVSLPEPADPLPSIGEDEIENAFEAAESSPDEMWNANHLVAAALNQIEEGTPEGVALDQAGSGSSDGLASPFATGTVANLLEEQGFADRARALREAISTDENARRVDAGSSDPDGHLHIIATLERWLDNLRRES